MALSNWDTLAVEFEVMERVLSPENASEEAKELSVEIDEILAPLKKHRDDVDRTGVNAIMNKIENDGEYFNLVAREREARTVRETKLTSSNGVFQSPTSNFFVEIYKNWAYLHSPSTSTGKKNMDLTRPAVGQLMEGDLRIAGLEIKAIRGPQEGIVLLAYTTDNGEDAQGHYYRYQGLLGTGVYGYDDVGEFVGVLPKTTVWIREQACTILPSFVCAIDLLESERFNQGDAFFAEEFGIETPASNPGEVSEPLINDAIKGIQLEK